MPESQAGLAGRMKWLVLRYPKPPGSIIALGSILSRADDPETRLNHIIQNCGSSDMNTDHLDNVDRPYVHDESTAVQRSIQVELSNDRSAFAEGVAPVLFGLGVHADGKSSNSVQTTVDALNVVAQVFQPPQMHLDLYMKRAVADPGVQHYMRSTFFSKKLYLVVGIATADTLSVKEARTQESSVVASGGIGLQPGTVHAAAESAHHRRCNNSSDFVVGKTCVFAYRVREFICYKTTSRRAVKDKGDVSRGAMFALDDGDGDREDTSAAEAAFVATFNTFTHPEDVSHISDASGMGNGILCVLSA
ncbi:vacuolar protein sorting protein [Purpureocillium lavendulum]|uniref:Vacuolar protein sorting protein n=1 Tax=Purpureocillium lavendulum TaxID=1247861 RepID=A0AB34G6L6_9HYPO|nr:vacuolar protein sorting protein [Purpureocillium lavendulum]